MHKQERDLLDRSIEVLAHDFSLSFTHPRLVDRIEAIWVVSDAPRKSGDYRREIWSAHGVDPKRLHQVACKHTRGRFAICAFYGVEESDELLRTGFKALNYRLGSTDAVMAHDLKRIPRCQKPVQIKRVLDEALADRLNQAVGSRQILPDHLSRDASLRQYVALDGDELIGWVRSHDVGHSTCCSNMHVHPEYRRRGIARAMMVQMLRDDRAAGSKLAVLTASRVGAQLYPVVGYRKVGTMMYYTPRKR